jgi:hypothetical protein
MLGKHLRCCLPLQAPLASLNAATHVTYRLTRTRIAATDLVFSSAANPLQRAGFRQALYQRALELQSEHNTLLYGGRIMLQVRQLLGGCSQCMGCQSVCWQVKGSFDRSCAQAVKRAVAHSLQERGSICATAATTAAVQANVSFDGTTPAALFQNADVSGEQRITN